MNNLKEKNSNMIQPLAMDIFDKVFKKILTLDATVIAEGVRDYIKCLPDSKKGLIPVSEFESLTDKQIEDYFNYYLKFKYKKEIDECTDITKEQCSIFDRAIKIAKSYSIREISPCVYPAIKEKYGEKAEACFVKFFYDEEQMIELLKLYLIDINANNVCKKAFSFFF